MRVFTSSLKLMLLFVMVMIGQTAFAGGSSSSSVTVNVSEEDTGKGYVYVSSDRVKPADDAINEGGWYNTSSYPINTMTENDTHYYHIAGKAAEGYKFAGVKKAIDEGVFGELIPADEEGFCDVSITCTLPMNVAIYYAVFESVTTDIKGIETTINDGRAYNLQGQQVNSDVKGILIRNGKKQVVK